ncbi:MAG TPA: hypothetical protein VF220_06620 [Nitrososphaeraceae archaeon]
MQSLRVEILLPLKYNDNTPVEKRKFTETFDDIVIKFGGITIDDSPIMGGWIDPATKRRYEEEMIVYWVMCEDTEENKSMLGNLKLTLIDRFKQIEIVMYYVIIHRL